MLAEEKIYDLQMQERISGLMLDREEEGTFSLPSFKWSVKLNDSAYEDLKILNLKVNHTGRRGLSLDTVIYLTYIKEE